jgi:hypothetical protein
MQKIAKTSIKTLKATVAELPNNKNLVALSKRVLPELGKMF